MSPEKDSESTLEFYLSRIPYPGEEEEEIEAKVVQARMAERVSKSIASRSASECASQGRRSLSWAVAAGLNITLILLFEAFPDLIITSYGEDAFYRGMIFLFLGMSMSVSISGFIFSLDLEMVHKTLPKILRPIFFK